MPAMKEARGRQERIDYAVVAGRTTAGMSEAETRLVYGTPFRIKRDSVCQRLIGRGPDHDPRVCVGQVFSVLY